MSLSSWPIRFHPCDLHAAGWLQHFCGGVSQKPVQYLDYEASCKGLVKVGRGWGWKGEGGMTLDWVPCHSFTSFSIFSFSSSSLLFLFPLSLYLPLYFPTSPLPAFRSTFLLPSSRYWDISDQQTFTAQEVVQRQQQNSTVSYIHSAEPHWPYEAGLAHAKFV